MSIHQSSIHRISKNSLFLITARIIDTIGQLIIIYFISRYLGPKQYGNYGYVMAFAILITGFTYSGIERIVTREISKNQEQAGYYVGGGLIVRWGLMSIVLAIMATIIILMNLPREIIIGIFIATVSMNLRADTFIYLGMFRAFEDMKYEMYLTFLFQLFCIAYILFVVFFDWGFISIFAGILGADTIRTLVAIFLACKKFVPPHFNINQSKLKYIVKESWILTIFIMATHAFINTDLFLLKQLADTFDLSMFYAPHNLIIMMTIVPISLMSGFFPSLSRTAKSDPEYLSYKYQKSFKLLSMCSIFIAVIFIVYADKIIMLLYGKEFFLAKYSFLILGPCFIFTTLFSIFDTTLVAVSKQNILILCPLMGVAAKIVLGFILIPKYGHIGASSAAFIGYFLFFISGFIVTSKYVGSLSIKKIIVNPIIISGIIGVCLYGINAENLILIIFLICLSFTLYIFFLYRLNFFITDEVDYFKEILQKTMIAVCRKASYRQKKQ